MNPTSASITHSPRRMIHSLVSEQSDGDVSPPVEEIDAQVTPQEDRQPSPIMLFDHSEKINLVPVESLSDCTPLVPAEDQNVANPISEWIQDTIPDALEQERCADATVNIDLPGPAEVENLLLVPGQSKKAKKKTMKKKKGSASKGLDMSMEHDAAE